jgi:hypothetical protein
MNRLPKRGLQNSNAVFNRKPMRLSFHKQRAVKRGVGIAGRQYCDIGNARDAVRIHFIPPPPTIKNGGQGYFCAYYFLKFFR